MSSEAGHTPGPWRQNPYDERFIETDEDSAANIARVLWLGDRAQADACLIAAAPELLEVAKVIMPLLEDWHEDDGRAWPAWRRTRAAIDKAEGRT